MSIDYLLYLHRIRNVKFTNCTLNEAKQQQKQQKLSKEIPNKIVERTHLLNFFMDVDVSIDSFFFAAAPVFIVSVFVCCCCMFTQILSLYVSFREFFSQLNMYYVDTKKRAVNRYDHSHLNCWHYIEQNLRFLLHIHLYCILCVNGITQNVVWGETERGVFYSIAFNSHFARENVNTE